MKIKTKKCVTGAIMLQLDGNTLHSLHRHRDKLGTYYTSDSISGFTAKTIADAKAKTEQLIQSGRFSR